VSPQQAKLRQLATGVDLDSNTQTDFIKNQEVAIAPAFTWRPDNVTTFAILGKYIARPAEAWGEPA
jgi:hypothetical protein